MFPGFHKVIIIIKNVTVWKNSKKLCKETDHVSTHVFFGFPNCHLCAMPYRYENVIAYKVLRH